MSPLLFCHLVSPPQVSLDPPVSHVSHCGHSRSGWRLDELQEACSSDACRHTPQNCSSELGEHTESKGHCLQALGLELFWNFQ